MIRFLGIASKFQNVMTETDPLDHVLSGKELQQDIVFIVQQGVDLWSLTSAIKTYSKRTQITSKYSIEASICEARATKRFAHKSRSENILISTPRKLADRKFEMDLCFSSQNEFFLDHMTGMHIQGMALIEAARQAFLAVTESHFLDGSSEDYYFVIKSMDTSFQNFVFPFDATLTYDITKISPKKTRLGVEATITITQSDVVCAVIKVAFTAFEAEKIAARERDVAQTFFDELGQNYQSPKVIETVI